MHATFGKADANGELCMKNARKESREIMKRLTKSIEPGETQNALRDPISMVTIANSLLCTSMHLGINLTQAVHI